MKSLFVFGIFLLVRLPVAFGQGTIEDRIDLLLSKMTVEEKIGQLSQPVLTEQNQELFERIENGEIGSFCVINKKFPAPEERNRLQRIAVEKSRLGIPLFFGFDVIHGFTTIFPTPLGASASWDPGMLRKTSAVAAFEARSSGMDVAFSPMVDVSRDARWGRVSECFGEDVLINETFGRAVVEGFHGSGLSQPDAIGACVKHFVGYGRSLGGRDKQFTGISRRALLETYLPPFKACIDAGAIGVMTAFNDIAGVPSTANHFTLTGILKQQWGFDGFTLSDWDAVIELKNHGIAGTDKEAAEKSITAGTDVEMKSNTYQNLLQSVKEGKVEMGAIDEAVKRVLRVKFRLGLFENPYIDVDEAYEAQTTKERRTLARQAAAESIVLLKNENVLPLKENIASISLVGPYVDNRDLYGWWVGHGKQEMAVTVAEGIKANLPAEIDIWKGTNPKRKPGITIVCVGEPGNTFGESHSLTDITLSKSQVELVKEVKASGSKVVLVVFNGRPMVLTPVIDYADAILIAWHPGIEAGNALADVLFGKVNPSGKLTCSFPKSTGQLPLFYSDRTSGRPHEDRYLDSDASPLFPFGFGMSYTEFEYSKLRLSTGSMQKDGKITVSVDVTNTGTRDGKEVVQLYVHDKVAQVTRPQKELKNFRKVYIRKGETQNVSFTLKAKELSFYDLDLKRTVEAGEFDLWIGKNSVEGLKSSFIIE